MKCEKHSVVSTFCRYCDLETIKKHDGKSKKILVEESALDSIQAMVKQLQDERDELLEVVKWFVENDDTNEGDVPLDDLGGESWNEYNKFWIDGLNRGRAIIAKCTAKPKVLE